MKKLMVLASWGGVSTLTLVLSLVLLTQNSHSQTIKKLTAQTTKTLTAAASYSMYTALPTNAGVISSSVQTQDGREAGLEQFLTFYNSPLAPYAGFIVDTAEKYDIDFRLIPAIAMQESGGGKVIPYGSYNAWGFQNGATKFNSWEHAIDRVAITLKKGYIDQGLTTPELIMPKYAPPSVEKGGPWAKGVSYFMDLLQ